jgi:hypothetical protein
VAQLLVIGGIESTRKNAVSLARMLTMNSVGRVTSLVLKRRATTTGRKIIVKDGKTVPVYLETSEGCWQKLTGKSLTHACLF